MTTLNLPRLRELLQASSMRPWSVPTSFCINSERDGEPVAATERRYDADLIVSAVNALPALLALATAALAWRDSTCIAHGDCDPRENIHANDCPAETRDATLRTAIDAARKAP